MSAISKNIPPDTRSYTNRPTDLWGTP